MPRFRFPGRAWRALRRVTPRRRGLHVCRRCGSGFVNPVRWSFAGDETLWLALRCGECGSRGETFAPADAVEAFERVLDEGERKIGEALERLDLERMASQAEAFSIALDRDLIDADDFLARAPSSSR